jgi:hypothetical protein
MKKYSCKKAKKGKTAFRTPSRFIYETFLKSKKNKTAKKN